jgi:hypothetical protein
MFSIDASSFICSCRTRSVNHDPCCNRPVLGFQWWWKIDELREQRQDFKLIESTPTTISGNYPAHKLVYTFLKEDGPRAGELNKVLRIWSIKDSKLYTIAYLSELDKFADHLPEVEKSIDSFRISPVIQKTSTRSSDSNNDNVNNIRDGNDNQKNWRDDPDCWYYSTFVCDENGRCDSENFDCVTDCDDGSSVTTGQPVVLETAGFDTTINILLFLLSICVHRRCYLIKATRTIATNVTRT